MTIRVTPTHGTLGAEVSGVSLRQLEDTSLATIEDAFNEYGVLVFPDQQLTQGEQVEFALRFGKIEINGEYTLSARNEVTGFGPGPVIVQVSNVDPNGVHIKDANHPLTRLRVGNEGWHSDSSFKPHAAKASILAAQELPTKGGNTEFADMRAAFDALTDDEKLFLRPLRAWHSIRYSNASIGASEEEPTDDPREMPGAEHALVHTHPVTGRPSLFIGRHACAIRGMEIDVAQDLLARLLADACRPPRIYSHKWRVGDVLVWDNRCVLHRVTPWDLAERRVLRHVRVAGESEEGAAPKPQPVAASTDI